MVLAVHTANIAVFILKSKLEFKSRLPIPEFFGYHCIIAQMANGNRFKNIENLFLRKGHYKEKFLRFHISKKSYKYVIFMLNLSYFQRKNKLLD